MKLNLHGVNYNYEIYGHGEPLLLLHGFTGSRTTWYFLKNRLSAQFRMIMVDLAGHGKTDKPSDPGRYAMTETAKDLALLLDRLGLDRVHVLGYSMGGRVALSFACLYPERVQSLILESASPGLADEPARRERRARDRRLADSIIHKGIPAFVAYWEQIPLFESQKCLPAEKKAALRQQRLANNAQGLFCSLTGMGTGTQPSRWDDLDTLSLPVLLITGTLDRKFCRIASSMNERLNRGEWQTVPEAGHAVHLENDAVFTEIVRSFLNRQTGSMSEAGERGLSDEH